MTDTVWVGRKKVTVTDQDVDDIMTTALEGGITDWCYKAEIVGERLGEYASEQISRGGILKLYGTDEINGDSKWWLDREKFLKGLKTFLKKYADEDDCLFREDDGYTLDCGNVDSFAADMIVQCAIFGEPVYG